MINKALKSFYTPIELLEEVNQLVQKRKGINDAEKFSINKAHIEGLRLWVEQEKRKKDQK